MPHFYKSTTILTSNYSLLHILITIGFHGNSNKFHVITGLILKTKENSWIGQEMS